MRWLALLVLFACSEPLFSAPVVLSSACHNYSCSSLAVGKQPHHWTLYWHSLFSVVQGDSVYADREYHFDSDSLHGDTSWVAMDFATAAKTLYRLEVHADGTYAAVELDFR